MVSEKLLPCPFCGNAGVIESYPSYSQAANNYDRHRGWCDTCDYGLDWHSYEADAIAAWNTRAPADLRSALEALSSLERQATALYRGIAPHGNYGVNNEASEGNANTFADQDPAIAQARAVLAALAPTKEPAA